MKFRRLNAEELKELETEFIRFLASNTVTGDDWEKLKKENPQNANKLIELFSDIVFEKILKDVQYLEFKSPSDLKTFHCGTDKIKLLGLRIEGESTIDFTKNQAPAEMLQLLQASKAKLQLYEGEKAYSKERALELFGMMENGALISKDGNLYKMLNGLKE